MCETFANASSLYIIPLLSAFRASSCYTKTSFELLIWKNPSPLPSRRNTSGALEKHVWCRPCNGASIGKEKWLVRWWFPSLESNWVAQCVPRSPAPDWIALRLTRLWRLGVIATVLRKSEVHAQSLPLTGTRISVVTVLVMLILVTLLQPPVKIRTAHARKAPPKETHLPKSILQFFKSNICYVTHCSSFRGGCVRLGRVSWKCCVV